MLAQQLTTAAKNRQMVIVEADLAYALEFGCLCKNGSYVGTGDWELAASLRDNMRKERLAERHDWIYGHQQPVVVGGVLVTVDVSLFEVHGPFMSGSARLFDGQASMTLVKEPGCEWLVSTLRETVT